MKVDRSTPYKSVFVQRALHGEIVRMGIDLEVLTAGERIVKAEFCHTLTVYGDRDAVDHAVRCFIEPSTPFNIRIRRIVPKEIAEHAEDRFILYAKV